MTARPLAESPVFDLALLPPAGRQLPAISDTHDLEWASVNQFPARAAGPLLPVAGHPPEARP